ncbi:MAG: Mth938-like domain-containing protein [Betaproteobacteria bacterium]|nr:Mth938-like domain-containing protein [Betaproteobacteria bacterium]
MKLDLVGGAGKHLFTGYGEGYVTINHQRYDRSLVVWSDRVEDWRVSTFEALTRADFEPLARLGAEIVLLGTGRRLRFPHPSLTESLARAHVGLEVMDLFAACRTYNILASEGRAVAAALLLE